MEFVLVLPLLLILVFGIIEFGNLWRTYQITTNAAREGAREAILPGTGEDQVTAVLDNYLSNSGLDTTKATYTFNDGNGLCPATSTSCTGQLEEVEVSYPFTMPIFGGVIELVCSGCGDQYGTITMTTESVMRHE